MHTHPKIFVLGAYNFEKMPKMGFRISERRKCVFKVL